VQYWF